MRPKEKITHHKDEEDLLDMFAHLTKAKKERKLHKEKKSKGESVITANEFSENESEVGNWEKDTDLESFIMG